MTETDTIASLFDDIEKPPYWVRSMEERALIPRNGLTAVSTFSGCGGSSLGLKTAGWTIPYAVEFTPGGVETYSANFPDTFVDSRDVREVTGAQILDRIGLDVGELDLLEGSPPCSSFSMAGAKGKYEDTIGKVKDYSEGKKQRTDDLFDEWLRLILELKPRAILAENVPALARVGAPAKYLASILSKLHDAGYDVHADVYSSLWVGAATRRTRLIIMGVRRDVGVVPRPKLNGEGYTIAEALATLPIESPADEWGEAWADGTGIRASTGEPMMRYAMADLWDELKPGEAHEKRFNLQKARLDRPAPTFLAMDKTAGVPCVMHPYECRRFTPTEIKWMSGFPADFLLPGTPTQRWERLGRAVTPPLYEAIGTHLARAIS